MVKYSSFRKVSGIFATFSVIFTLATFSSCSVKDPEFQEISNIEFLNQQDSFVMLRVDVIIQNFQRIGAQISKIQGDLLLGNTQIAIVDNNEKFYLKARDTSLLPIMITVSLPALSKCFSSVMASDSVDFTLNGNFFVDIGISEIRIKRRISKRIDIQEELKKQMSMKVQNSFKLAGVIPKSVKLDSTLLQLDLEFINPLGIEFVLQRASMDISMKNQNKAFGNWLLPNPIRMTPGEKSIVHGEITVSNADLFRQGMQSIFGPIVIHAKGNATVQLDAYEFNFPMEQFVEMKTAMGF